MLVVTRKANESITIGDNIVITVVEARSGSVRIGTVASLAFRVGAGIVAKRCR